MAKNKLKEPVEKFLDLLGIKAEVSVEESEDQISVSLETEDTGMIIGYHGETLESLQLILALLLAKETGEFKRVSLEVGDYKKNRTEYLERMAMEFKERALSSQKEVYISDLKSWERRIIHLILHDDKEVVSESSGEGRDRVLVIKPK